MRSFSNSKTLLFVVGLILLSGSLKTNTAQTGSKGSQPGAKKMPPVITAAQQRGLENLDRISLEARQIENPKIRTHLQALIGDALWDFDKANARSIFIDAFKNARSIENPIEARAVQTEVIRQVWTRDRALADELMKQLADDSDQKSVESNKDFGLSSQFGMQSSDPNTQQKLNLARSLLEDDPAAAADLIQSAFGREVTFTAVNRLLELKSRDPESANRIFERALVQLPSMPSTVAVTAAIAMADYAFPSCSLCAQRAADTTLSEAYYAIALRVLRRSIGESFAPPPVSRDLQEKVIQYFHEMQALLAMTLSRFAKPADLGELQTIFRTQLQALEPRKQQMLGNMEQTQKAPDKFEALFHTIESVQDPEERDKGLFSAVQLALSQNLTDELLEKLEGKVDKIESKSLHDKAWSLLKLREIDRLIKAGDLERTHVLALKLPDPMARAKALRTLAAAVARKGSDTMRAQDLLSEATESMKKTDPSIEKTQILFKITSDFVNLRDHERAFDTLEASSQSLAQLKRDDFEQTSRAAVPNSFFDYGGTFGRLGNVDFDKSMFLAQTIRWREFRLAAEIVTCSSVLKRRQP